MNTELATALAQLFHTVASRGLKAEEAPTVLLAYTAALQAAVVNHSGLNRAVAVYAATLQEQAFAGDHGLYLFLQAVVAALQVRPRDRAAAISSVVIAHRDEPGFWLPEPEARVEAPVPEDGLAAYASAWAALAETPAATHPDLKDLFRRVHRLVTTLGPKDDVLTAGYPVTRGYREAANKLDAKALTEPAARLIFQVTTTLHAPHMNAEGARELRLALIGYNAATA